MDPIAGFVLSFMTLFAIGNEVNRLEEVSMQQEATLALYDAEIVELQRAQEAARDAYTELADSYNGLYEEYLRVASSHASVAARDLVYHDQQQEAIEQILKEIHGLQDKTNYLDEKIELLHP